ncbi:MAG: hypothetical protein WC455_28205 [Dehalococcoidia bacterium]|jgi:hypothetical protein
MTTLSATATLHIRAIVTGAKWNSDWYPPIATCYLNGQIITVGSATWTTSPSQSRTIRWTDIGGFDFIGQTADAMKNEAGESYGLIRDDEILLQVLPLGNMAIVYGSFSVLAMKPISKPVVSFGVVPIAEMYTGIPCTLAAGGSREKHLIVGRDGNLWLIKATVGMFGGDSYEVKNLGYSEFFADMVKNCDALAGKNLISVLYNKQDDEFYISNGYQHFMYCTEGLTELGTAIAGFINLENSAITDTAVKTSIGMKPVGFTMQNDAKFAYETDNIDLGLSGIKTIESVTVVGAFADTALIEVMVKWRNSRKQAFNETSWKRVSPEGYCVPMVAGLDLRICVRANTYLDAEVNNLIVGWKLTDKRFIRGMQNADRASS